MEKLFVELLGIIASVFIVISLLFKTSTRKGGILLRCFNIVGSVLLAVYGSLLPSISIIVLNIVGTIVNIYQLVLLMKDKKQI